MTGGGGGGAGGFRESKSSKLHYMQSFRWYQLLPVTATGYPITVGGGGAA